MYLPRKEQFHFFEETSSGVFGLFDEPEQILEAARQTRDKKYYVGFDCLTPFPVHGLDDAMGLPRSGIPWITFIMGIIGLRVAWNLPDEFGLWLPKHCRRNLRRQW
jgi:hypothetical protein